MQVIVKICVAIGWRAFRELEIGWSWGLETWDKRKISLGKDTWWSWDAPKHVSARQVEYIFIRLPQSPPRKRGRIRNRHIRGSSRAYGYDQRRQWKILYGIPDNHIESGRPTIFRKDGGTRNCGYVIVTSQQRKFEEGLTTDHVVPSMAKAIKIYRVLRSPDGGSHCNKVVNKPKICLRLWLPLRWVSHGALYSIKTHKKSESRRRPFYRKVKVQQTAPLSQLINSRSIHSSSKCSATNPTHPSLYEILTRDLTRLFWWLHVRGSATI